MRSPLPLQYSNHSDVFNFEKSEMVLETPYGDAKDNATPIISTMDMMMKNQKQYVSIKNYMA